MVDFKSEAYKNWNDNVVTEFRAQQGKVGGQFEGVKLLLLTTKGAKTGQERTTPLVYAQDGSRLLIFGSKGGAPQHPAWFNNLVANPTVTLEVGSAKYAARATVLQGEERDRLFARQAEAMPNFAEYQANTSRTIPVVALERV